MNKLKEFKKEHPILFAIVAVIFMPLILLLILILCIWFMLMSLYLLLFAKQDEVNNPTTYWQLFMSIWQKNKEN